MESGRINKEILKAIKIAFKYDYLHESDLEIIEKHVSDTSTILRVKINKVGNERTVIVKLCSADEKLRDNFPFRLTYEKEIYAYERFIEYSEKMQQTLDSDMRINFVKYYGGTSKEDNEYIILEDIHDEEKNISDVYDTNIEKADDEEKNISDVYGTNIEKAEIHDKKKNISDVYDTNIEKADDEEKNISDVYGTNIEKAEIHDEEKNINDVNGTNIEKADIHDEEKNISDVYDTNIEKADIHDEEKNISYVYDTNIEKAEKVIQILAVLHGLSFVMKTKTPDKFNEFADKTKLNYSQESVTKIGKNFRNLVELALNHGFMNLENVEHKRKFAEITKNGFDDNGKELRESDFKVICHGDCHGGNFLEGKGKTWLIDFQFLRTASPVTDIHLFMMTSTTKLLRDLHYEKLIDLHYTTMSEVLQKFSVDISIVYPRKFYEKELKDKAIVGLVQAAITFMRASDNRSTILDYFSGQLKK